MKFIPCIASTGTQYVDTGFMPNQDTRVVMDVMIQNPSENPYCYGAMSVSSVNGFYTRAEEDDFFTVGYGNTSSSSGCNVLNRRITIDHNKTTATVGSSTYTIDEKTFQCDTSLYLFWRSGNNSNLTKAIGYLYSCQIYDNGTLIRDYWPCLDDAGIPCLYDKVNGTFAYSAGAEDFVVYPSVFMPHIFEPPVIAEPIAVAITRTYSDSGRPIVVNGTSYTSAGTASTTVLAGDVISFTIGGLTVTDYLDIDGTTVAYVASGADRQTYKWTVPDGISSITIEDSGRRITVTTS